MRLHGAHAVRLALVAVALPKGDRDLLAWVNDQLRKAKADGTYDRLWNRYFGEAGTILLRP